MPAAPPTNRTSPPSSRLCSAWASPGTHLHGQGLTGTNRNRPGLDQALAAVRAGDTLVVPKLDRLARSVPDARAIGDSLVARGVKLSLGGTIYDPADPMGKMFFNILATFAEFEVDLIRLRTREGMAIARAKGKLKGKPPKLTDASRPIWSSCTGGTHHRRPGRPVLRLPAHRLPRPGTRPRHQHQLVGRQRYVVRPIPCHKGDRPLVAPRCPADALACEADAFPPLALGWVRPGWQMAGP